MRLGEVEVDLVTCMFKTVDSGSTFVGSADRIINREMEIIPFGILEAECWDFMFGAW